MRGHKMRMNYLFVLEQPTEYKESRIDQDGLWKKVIGDVFERFLQFFAPILFLQQELFQEVVDSKKGRRMADQLVKVHLKDGQEIWILVHVEVQSDNEEDFS